MIALRLPAGGSQPDRGSWYDETLSKKGNNYLTFGVDMASRWVILTEGKASKTVTAIKNHLESKGAMSEKIFRSIDLSPAFIRGVTDEFPAAQITFDRFHVKTLLNKALEEVLKSQRRQHQQLKHHKYTFLKVAGKLTGPQWLHRDDPPVPCDWRALPAESVV